jgi:primosomal protein N' (replication factor Y) (superfamily II helicase)
MEQPGYYLITPLAYTGAAVAFTYHSELGLVPGSIVEIPVGRRQVLGVVEETVERPAFATKPVARVFELPPITPELHQLAHWLSRYYAASPASVWSTMLPTGLAKKRRVSDARSSEGSLDARHAPTEDWLTHLPPLTTDQAAALARIRTSNLSAHLLQGVTGSGKTRLYLELAAQTLAAGRSTLVLVPEIILTPQIVSQFEAAFGSRVLTSHSKLTESQRHRIWLEAVAAHTASEPRIIIGPRSCLFMPTHKLGLIVVDECHESSYKQDQHPRYHAVTTAARLAQLTSARLILGSATPGLNELYLANEHRLEHILLPHRINKIPQSQATIIDLRNKDNFESSKFITQELLDAVAATIAAGRQTLLYLGRRGSASSQVCGDCGHVTTCPHCQLPLTFHADLMRLICHHCNFRTASPAVCPACSSANLRLIGAGTKRVEAEIGSLFPEARIARLDRDSATLSHLRTVLRDLGNRQLDIIIGTQMITGGLDFAGLDTIGVISADTLLHLPDFTAAERTFQLLSQVSGRAGRGDRPGQIFIQTYTPDHPAIVAAASNNYNQFAATELAQRRDLRYPPFAYLLKLTVAAATRQAATTEATTFANQLRSQPGLDVAGPAPAFIETAGGKYHWLITIKSARRPPLVNIAQNLPGPHWTADLDPINLL